eukprot:NODE_3000_length_1070_cov_21.208619_g2752_i0.p1 GENE.NODE_3000_length_1070_cov_21.208619_g2752_i0~~NODE_3000_length_1070_cov_21.208619_g2752_i0.p1  ORF type:complete len:309 (-),score=79.22 NODE_3000_length_1070_cov_21.208619_g2752_i0:142-1020(-)
MNLRTPNKKAPFSDVMSSMAGDSNEPGQQQQQQEEAAEEKRRSRRDDGEHAKPPSKPPSATKVVCDMSVSTSDPVTSVAISPPPQGRPWSTLEWSMDPKSRSGPNAVPSQLPPAQQLTEDWIRLVEEEWKREWLLENSRAVPEPLEELLDSCAPSAGTVFFQFPSQPEEPLTPKDSPLDGSNNNDGKGQKDHDSGDHGADDDGLLEDWELLERERSRRFSVIARRKLELRTAIALGCCLAALMAGKVSVPAAVAAALQAEMASRDAQRSQRAQVVHGRLASWKAFSARVENS